MREIISNQRYSRIDVQASLHFIDYLLQLPKSYTEQLSVEMRPIIRKEKGLMELYNKENSPPTFKNAFDIEFEKGREQGREQNMIEVAKRLLLNDIPVETISNVTELSFEEIKKIEQTLN